MGQDKREVRIVNNEMLVTVRNATIVAESLTHDRYNLSDSNRTLFVEVDPLGTCTLGLNLYFLVSNTAIEAQRVEMACRIASIFTSVDGDNGTPIQASLPMCLWMRRDAYWIFMTTILELTEVYWREQKFTTEHTMRLYKKHIAPVLSNFASYKDRWVDALKPGEIVLRRGELADEVRSKL